MFGVGVGGSHSIGETWNGGAKKGSFDSDLLLKHYRCYKFMFCCESDIRCAVLRYRILPDRKRTWANEIFAGDLCASSAVPHLGSTTSGGGWSSVILMRPQQALFVCDCCSLR